MIVHDYASRKVSKSNLSNCNFFLITGQTKEVNITNVARGLLKTVEYANIDKVCNYEVCKK